MTGITGTKKGMMLLIISIESWRSALGNTILLTQFTNYKRESKVRFIPSQDVFLHVFFCLLFLFSFTVSPCTSSRAGALVFWPQSEHSWRRRRGVGPSPGKTQTKGRYSHAGIMTFRNS